MTIVDTLAAQPLYNLDSSNPFTPFGSTPLIPFNGQLYYCAVNTVAVVPLFPNTNGQTAVIAFTFSSSAPAIAIATLSNGRTLTLLPLAAGNSNLSLTATDTNGNAAQTTLAVTVIPDPFLAYLTAAGVPPAQRAPTADPDADGIPNLLEYALGGDPLSPGATDIPVCGLNGGNLTLTYKRATSDIAYAVQTTTNLTTPSSWTTANVTQGTPATDGLTTATIPLGGPARFLRLRVALTP